MFQKGSEVRSPAPNSLSIFSDPIAPNCIWCITPEVSQGPRTQEAEL